MSKDNKFVRQYIKSTIYYELRGTYNTNSQIKFKSLVLIKFKTKF